MHLYTTENWLVYSHPSSYVFTPLPPVFFYSSAQIKHFSFLLFSFIPYVQFYFLCIYFAFLFCCSCSLPYVRVGTILVEFYLSVLSWFIFKMQADIFTYVTQSVYLLFNVKVVIICWSYFTYLRWFACSIILLFITILDLNGCAYKIHYLCFCMWFFHNYHNISNKFFAENIFFSESSSSSSSPFLLLLLLLRIRIQQLKPDRP